VVRAGLFTGLTVLLAACGGPVDPAQRPRVRGMMNEAQNAVQSKRSPEDIFAIVGRLSREWDGIKLYTDPALQERWSTGNAAFVKAAAELPRTRQGVADLYQLCLECHEK